METVEQRLAALERSANTTAAVTTNALVALITAVTRIHVFDRELLWKELNTAMSKPVPNGNQEEYKRIISLLQSQIS